MPNLGLSSRAIIGRFYQKLEAAFDRSWASAISMRFESDQESETYRWLGMTPPLREWSGERAIKQLTSNGITITNKTFEATLEVNVDDLRRDKTGQILVRIDELAERAAQHWDKLLHELIAHGADSTYGLAYDGQYFFDTDHAEESSGVQTNDLVASDIPALNVSNADAPTQQEMTLAIMGVIAWMLGYKDDHGEPMNGNARRWLVMTPTNLWGPALAAASVSRVIGSGGTVSDNVLLAAGFDIQVACNPRLTNANQFYVFRTDGATRPFIIQEEQPLTVQALADGSEQEFLANRHLYGVKLVGNVGYGQWQHAARATLS